MPLTDPVVAVTGLEGRDNPYPGVAIARALKMARGERVTLVGLAYDPTLTGCFRDDLFDRVYQVPMPGDPPSTVIRRLIEIRAEFPIDVLIPGLDSEIANYANHASALASSGIRTMLPPPSSVKARYKDRLEAFCRANGFLTPQTAVVVDPVKTFGVVFPLPCFVKGMLADAQHVASREEALAAYWRTVARWGYPVLAQQIVAGEEYDVCAVAKGGEIVSMIAIKKTATSRSGKGIGAVVVDEPAVLDVARRITRALSWEGPLELEFVREASSGEFFLIEINARFPAWCAATASMGVNLPDVLLRLVLGESLPDRLEPTPGSAFVRISRTTITDVARLGELHATGRVVHERRIG